MKKLKLNLREFNNTEVLTRSQLKNVLGGSPGLSTGSAKFKCVCSSGTTTFECDSAWACVQKAWDACKDSRYTCTNVG